MTPGSPSNRVVIVVLAVVAGCVTLLFAAALVLAYPQGVDLQIPLRAAQRWGAGLPPYVPAPPGVRVGPDLPFLYPPFLLPLVSPLLAVPREPLLIGWSAVCFCLAIYSCRRLGIPYVAALPIMLWPPFLEGILGGNVQIAVFAAFVTAFWRWPVQAAWRPWAKDETALCATSLADGLLATSVGALKVTQVHAWLLILRERPATAIRAALLLGVVALATVPATGLALYGAWLGQLSAAADPALGILGSPAAYFLPPALALGLLVATMLLVRWVPHPDAALWVGILMIVGSPSVQTFGWLFALPGLLVVRREIALICALLLATDYAILRWTALGLLVATLILSNRWPTLRQGVPKRPDARTATAG